MTDEGTRRPLHSDPIDGSNLSFSMSQGLQTAGTFWNSHQ
ncbi:MAG: hypothetical protein EZS28_047119, partial [Streblomastix strix]